MALNYLKPLTIAVYAAASLAVMSCFQIAMAQNAPILYQPNPDSPIGERNPNGPAELAQFDFVIGDWDVDITLTPPGREPFSYQAKWHNTWIINGNVVFQEWRGPYATGAEFRHYDTAQKKWLGNNIYSGQRWNTTWAERENDKMVVYINGEDQNGPFIARETYYDIEQNSIKMKSEKSFDDGKTWGPTVFHMVLTRIAD